jgi:hypothetical protein
MLSELRALIICYTILQKYIPTFYISLPRQFNLRAHCLERVSIHQPLPTFSILTKLKQKTEMWSLCLCDDDDKSECCNFCNETFYPAFSHTHTHTHNACVLCMLYEPLLNHQISPSAYSSLFTLLYVKKVKSLNIAGNHWAVFVCWFFFYIRSLLL